MTTFPIEFIKQIPKTDLHCHLDGSLRLTTLLELAQQQNIEIPASSVQELRDRVFKDCYNNLEEYLECFKYSVAVLRDKGAIERVSYELGVDQFSCGVRYFEVRFAPQLLAIPGQLSMEEILESVDIGLTRATNQFNSFLTPEEPAHHYGIIVCAMRFFRPEFGPYFEQFWAVHPCEEPNRIYGLASMALVTTAYKIKKEMGIPIVGLDIAGAENGYPAKDHKEAYEFARKKFLRKTVHAGESYGPESIFQAISDLHAERIGHGYHLFNVNFFGSDKTLEERQQYVEALTEYMAEQRICIEVCLSSNLQTVPENNNDIRLHPLQDMLKKRMAVTICTDNCTVSHTNVIKELQLACDGFELTPKQLKDIVITGFKRSFLPMDYVTKRAYIRSIITLYEKLEQQYLIQ